ncbi:DUF4132 domain-containing protein [Paenibacillus sp. SYP-B3998]|uniref:DUF4132 domain-containing protein n=1 Tax=Paenibacillus sp. SYP-B3998 TaxID=2678564 RepID=A0A6G3ZQY4_9BACL|nr:DUF4132 domain-containing protein [Paenibacillus sp. SYP-B3998]NEW04616.1 DUF4132 domain-containing protein [Paenibacillus sp. SYP-B3998]
MEKHEQEKHYYALLQEKAEGVDPHLLPLAKLVVEMAQVGYVRPEEECFLKCQEILLSLAAGNDNLLFEPLVKVVRQLTNEYIGEVFDYITDHATEYPYSTGYARRPFRTSDCNAHLGKVIIKMNSLIFMDCQGFAIIDYLTLADYPLKHNYKLAQTISDVIAYELDRNNTEVLTALKEIVYGDNQTALLTQGMIKGIFMSHHEELYVMMSELLTAARLQEGLRQSIVERMDEGTLKANLYMLKVIIDQGMIRYSSVVRALGVWTGMGLESTNQRVAGQLIEGAYRALNDVAIRESWLSSDNANQVYLSLWATAVFEECDFFSRIEYLMEHGKLYQKIIAQYVLANSENKNVRYGIARQYLDVADPELQHWILSNYSYDYNRIWKKEEDDGPSITIERSTLLENKEERRREFEQLEAMFLGGIRKETSAPSKVLDFAHVHYNPDLPIRKMLYLTAYDMDSEWIAKIIALKDRLSADMRGELLFHFMEDMDHSIQREFIFTSLSDKSMSNREKALDKAKKLTLADEELKMVEDLLKLKTGSLRQSAIELLLRQPEDSVNVSLTRLLQGKSELQRLAALETIVEIFEDNERAEQYEVLSSLPNLIENPTHKEQQLIGRLRQKNEYTAANGFGLFDPKVIEPWLTEIPVIGEFDWKHIFTMSVEDVIRFLSGLEQEIHNHRDYEYEAEYYSGYKDTLLLGTELRRIRPFQEEEDDTAELTKYPLYEVWRDYLERSNLAASELMEIYFYSILAPLDQTLNQYYRYFSDVEKDYGKLEKHTLLEGSRKEFAEQVYPVAQIQEIKDVLKGFKYSRQISNLLFAYFMDSDKSSTFDLTINALSAVMQAMPKEKISKEWGILQLLANPWFSMSRSRMHDDDSFKRMFHTFYTFNIMNPNGNVDSTLDLKDYLRAFEAGMIGTGEVYRELVGSHGSRNHIRNITSKRYDWIDHKSKLMTIRQTAVERILEVELERGDLATELTPLAMGLERIEGMEHFIHILSGLQQETFIRGYIYGYGDSITKKESFSHLLKISYPRKGEDDTRLKQMLEGLDITEKRLLEAAMYAPQWLDIVAKYLNWDGLRSAAWYFHAHINEGFSAEKETVVAHYSPILAQDFNDGAFDIKWFKEAYNTLGEKRFDLLYDCAKYISAGANHRRSQLFADATLGKLDIIEIQKSVEEKRNKDHLLSYSLIPLVNNREQDIRERYEFIQRFLAQSKKFGAQRRASEGMTSQIALGNLARNAGYGDVIRLMWDMEARKLDDMQSYFQPYMLDEETAVQLLIDEEGQSEIGITRKGKELKAIPAKYKKDEYVDALKEMKSELTEQYRRARKELERSMESGNTFTLQELKGLSGNPVITPLLRTLVFKSGEILGYFDAASGGLIDPAGTLMLIGDSEELLIAHPLHLYESGDWSQYQKDLFDRQLRQPFKQVFRELYVPNADERAQGTISRRYAGHQVQPRKTVSLLKGRQWTVSYEEGLQKVYYAENLIANLYAMADWFSPSEIEAPTLETVQFLDRNTYKSVTLDKVPPILFSEVMRDIDLVVSVAHVGGVDPEASLTTIEMRRVIVKESLRLLKIDNVRLDGNYARIEGALGEYGVHLGSGMVYRQATGAMHIIPVHSQHRGRIFLPFIDEDPKTAEILSKIVMLAEDKKIKDPQILMQLQS